MTWLNDFIWKRKQQLRFKRSRLQEAVLYMRRNNPKYLIIQYDDSMSSGWTVWERVVLYNCIYAEDHGMIPVVDMQSRWNIYLEADEVGKTNAWEKYYEQPGGVSLQEALESKSYVKCDPSMYWFIYIRRRKSALSDNEYMRKAYNKYIHYNKVTQKRLDSCWNRLIADAGLNGGSRLMGVCVRGSDYKQIHHMMQPSIEGVKEVVSNNFSKYHCKALFLATEDAEVLEDMKKSFPDYKMLNYKAGEVKSTDDYIGKCIRKNKTADEAAFDYLMVLSGLNRCDCLVGGLCGATIVAKYKRETPYDYINIIDLKSFY